MVNATVFRDLTDTIKTAARSRRELHLSAADVQALSVLLDELIRADIAAYLQAMQDPAADAADERDFARASSAQFWADDDPADSIYDDL